MTTEDDAPLPSDPSTDRTSRLQDDELEEVLDRYMDEVADGKKPDQEEYLHAYPRLAEALRGVFKTLDFVEAAGKSLNASKLEAGQRLGEFRIVREIGRGGMGVVYEAVQTSLGRRVALKVLPANVTLSENALERFHREAHTGGRLHHTNIVPVYAVGEESGINYYAMQLIEGRSLAHYLKTAKEEHQEADREHFRRVAWWGQQAAEALAYAHDQGIIHRDIKPANLLFDKKENVWIFDFGLARATDDPTITASGDLLGTVRYMSPEQAGGGKDLDGRTDIYSLGATLYELASLAPVFEGESREQLLQQVSQVEPKPLRQSVRSVPRDLETIISKCLQKDRRLRYQKASQVAEDLRRYLAGEPILARRTPLYVKVGRWIRRHRWQVAAAVVGALLIVSGFVWTRELRREEGVRCLKEAYTAIMFDQEYQRGQELLDRAESLGVNSWELHLYRGLIPLLNEQPDLARPHIEKVRQMDPANMYARYALSRVYIDKGDFHTGQRLREAEGTAMPTTALGWFLRGYALSRSQESGAIDCYNEALKLQPDFVAAILGRATYRGVRLATEGRRDELESMLNDLEAVVVFRPNSSWSYGSRALGWVAAAAYADTQPDMRQSREGWLENCRRDLDQAMKLRHKSDPMPLAALGACLRYLGDYDGSAKAYGQATRIHQAMWGQPSRFYIHGRAISLQAMGDLQTALDEVSPLAEANPAFYSNSLHRAILLAELGRIDEARLACRECLKTQQGHASGVFMSAAVMELLGGFDEAQAAVLGLEARARESADVTFEYVPAKAAVAEIAYFTGRSDAAALLASSGDNPGRRCEHAFEIGMCELGHGHREAGLAMLQASVDTGVIFYGEYRFSQVLLERAKADPQWPRWVNPEATSQSAGGEVASEAAGPNEGP
jgi:tetratricopeptide (TPR) repeat protein